MLPRQKTGGRSRERLQLGVRAYYRRAAEGYSEQSGSPSRAAPTLRHRAQSPPEGGVVFDQQLGGATQWRAKGRSQAK